MVSNVNSISPAKVYEAGKPPDEKIISESSAAPAASVTDNTDKVEISNEAHTASINTQVVAVKQPTREFMEVFSVNIWSLGLEEQK